MASGTIHMLNLYNSVRDVEERKRLKDEYTQEMIISLIYVRGPQRLKEINEYFGVTRGRKGTKRIRENLKILTDKNWGGYPPILIVKNDRYAINRN